jgi:hypothetical protein
VQNTQVGQARFYNAPEVDQKFKAPAEPGTLGVEISVDAVKTKEAPAEIKKFKEDLTAAGIQFKPDESVTVSGLPGTKMPFVANYGAKNIMKGYYVLVPTDSMYYRFSFSGFGQFTEAHAGVFDAVLKSFQTPKPVEKGADPTLPAATLSEYNGKLFSFQYPENFNSTNPAKKNYEEVAELRGGRNDCSVRIDVAAAKGLTLEKVFEQSKSVLKGGSQGKATINGIPALTLTGAASKDVQRRFYFVVRNDKIIRITTDWYRPQTEQYSAAYDKLINSIKFK